MGLFTDYLYEKLPFSDITLEEIEKIAMHHFPEHTIYIENSTIFLKSDKLLDSRKYEFGANGEISLDRDTLCFKSEINKTTFIIYSVVLIILCILSVYKVYNSYKYRLPFLGADGVSQYQLYSGLSLLGWVVLYLVVFAIGLRYQLHRASSFFAKTITAAVKTYRMK